MTPTLSFPFLPGISVCAYLRDSGGSDQDLSVEQQAAEITTWCQQNALILSKVFSDKAMPGSSAIGRKGFQEMIQYFRSGNCQEKGLVIWKFSRFARDIDDAQFFKADLRRRGFEIYSIKDQIPEGSTGRFFEAALDWMNERFLEDLSTDVKRGQRHLVTQYGALGGYPPYGFVQQPLELGKRRDGRPHVVCRWVPDTDPVKREWVRCAWKLRADGLTYVEIHRQVPIYKMPKGFYRFFRNPLYKGTLRFSGILYPDYCEPLIDSQTWDQVQQLHLHYLKYEQKIS